MSGQATRPSDAVAFGIVYGSVTVMASPILKLVVH
jgi:hypothetical protein